MAGNPGHPAAFHADCRTRAPGQRPLIQPLVELHPLHDGARAHHVMPHPSGRSFQIDFDSHRVDILPVSGRGRSIALASRSVADFHTDLMGSLDELDLINADLANARGDRRGHSLTGRYFARVLDLAITRFSGRTAPPHPGGAPHCGPAVMHEAYSHELSSACYWPGGDTEGIFYAYAYRSRTDSGIFRSPPRVRTSAWNSASSCFPIGW